MSRTPRTHQAIRPWLLSLLLSAIAISAAPAQADSSPAQPVAPAEAVAETDRPSVDESALDTPPRTRVQARGGPVAPVGSPVLTRALVRQRIEAMDPSEWLARYGQVERRERP